MGYADRIYEELKQHATKMRFSQGEFYVGDKLVNQSKQRKMWKLLKYAKRANQGVIVNHRYFVRLCGRPNRTPWKCKGLPYVVKAERLRLHAETIKLFKH